MLKLLIADDERITRDTIASIIQWEKLGITLIGSAKNGIDAYNMILDETPDIVMTDIRMPGFSGLELVEAVSKTDLQTQFIILSGYEEFDYAREAMKYGIKHYLLKPCNAKQITECMLEITKDCYQERVQQEATRHKNGMLKLLRQDAMHHLITDGLSIDEESHNEVELLHRCIDIYKQYIDFSNSSFFVIYLHYLEQKQLEKMMSEFGTWAKSEALQTNLYGIYVKNTLILFGQDSSWQQYIEQLCADAYPEVEWTKDQYSDLFELMGTLLKKIKRYDKIYYIQEFQLQLILNNHSMIRQLKASCSNGDIRDRKSFEAVCRTMEKLVDGMEEVELLKYAAGNISMYFTSFEVFSTVESAEFMAEIGNIEESERIRSRIKTLIQRVNQSFSKEKEGYGNISDHIMGYVQEHIGDQGLTLKGIAEQELYMNVDYVSKKFQQSTGQKFSQYLALQRMKYAKELMISVPDCKIQYVAAQSGYGDNTQYFSQIFKKHEGMTPTMWLKKMT